MPPKKANRVAAPPAYSKGKWAFGDVSEEARKAAANLRQTPNLCSFPSGYAIPGYKKRAREVQRAAPKGSADRAHLDAAWADINAHKAKVKARGDHEQQWWDAHHSGTCGGPGCRCGGGFVAPWGTHGPVRWRLNGCLCKNRSVR